MLPNSRKFYFTQKNPTHPIRFPDKLWNIVNTCTSEAVRWGLTGRTIIINSGLFKRDYLERHETIFKTTNFTSFLRMLNLYGFRKLNLQQCLRSFKTIDEALLYSGKSYVQNMDARAVTLCGSESYYEFQHDYFVRGRPDLLPFIQKSLNTCHKKRDMKQTYDCPCHLKQCSSKCLKEASCIPDAYIQSYVKYSRAANPSHKLQPIQYPIQPPFSQHSHHSVQPIKLPTVQKRVVQSKFGSLMQYKTFQTKSPDFSGSQINIHEKVDDQPKSGTHCHLIWDDATNNWIAVHIQKTSAPSQQKKVNEAEPLNQQDVNLKPHINEQQGASKALSGQFQYRTQITDRSHVKNTQSIGVQTSSGMSVVEPQKIAIEIPAVSTEVQEVVFENNSDQSSSYSESADHLVAKTIAGIPCIDVAESGTVVSFEEFEEVVNAIGAVLKTNPGDWLTFLDSFGLKDRRSISHTKYLQNQARKIDMENFPPDRIRNFSIIAHIDHGKSTLADRLMEYTGTISKQTENKQVLDKLQVERERGITVKAQTASLIYTLHGVTYLLNLIDTPGHVDFNYEVSRSLAACQGVILLVDANQGVQAQTVANFFLAFERELVIIPVLNKIDLKGADPEQVGQQMLTLFDISPSDTLQVSAKLGTGVEALLEAIIKRIPSPTWSPDEDLKALIFDSWYDKYRGAVCSIAVLGGVMKKGDRIQSIHSGKTYDVQEVGIMYPHEYSTNQLSAGQVGYLYANMRTTKEAQVGDTLCLDKVPVKPLPGFKPARPMVFAGIFPVDQSEYTGLRSAIEKLILNDCSVSINVDSSAALGQGWRLGFLGLLHMDVFTQRLEQEYNANVIITSPNVPYKLKIKGAKNIKQYGGEEITLLNPCHFPDPAIVIDYQEPMVLGTIIAPDDYMGELTSLIMSRRGIQKEQSYIDNKRVLYKIIFPLNEVIVDFFDELKSITSGYASFDYEDYGYESSHLVKVDVALNGREVEELTQICHSSTAREIGKKIAAKLKEAIPRQLFMIAIQAKISGHVIARETVKPYRKDVLAKCYGGDITRKTKLLRQQAEGKRKMRKIGNIDIPKDAFISVLKK